MEIEEISLETIDSTQKWAKSNRSSLDPKKITCITAREQTDGIGRFQRKWYSPKGENIYATFVFFLPCETMHLISLSQIMTITLASLLIEEGLSPKVKWPNDILLDGKKLSGVLTETSFEKKCVAVYLGIGINVNMGEEDLKRIDQPAISLQMATKKSWSVPKLLKKLQNKWRENLDLFLQKGFEPFHASFENLMAFRGQEITIFDGEKEWTGICHSLSQDGQLNLCFDDGEIKTIRSGDIIKP